MNCFVEMKKLLACGVMVLAGVTLSLTLTTRTVQAATMVGFPPGGTDSYSALASYSGFQPYNTIELFIISDTGTSGSFASGALIDLTFAGTLPNPNYSVTTGVNNTTGSGVIEAFFTGTPSGVLDIDIIAWTGAVGSTLTDLTFGVQLTNGSLSSIFLPLACGALEECHYRAPEPSTLLLLASGLAGLGFFRWRRKQEA